MDYKKSEGRQVNIRRHLIVVSRIEQVKDLMTDKAHVLSEMGYMLSLSLATREIAGFTSTHKDIYMYLTVDEILVLNKLRGIALDTWETVLTESIESPEKQMKLINEIECRVNKEL